MFWKSSDKIECSQKNALKRKIKIVKNKPTSCFEWLMMAHGSQIGNAALYLRYHIGNGVSSSWLVVVFIVGHSNICNVSTVLAICVQCTSEWDFPGF